MKLLQLVLASLLLLSSGVSSGSASASMSASASVSASECSDGGGSGSGSGSECGSGSASVSECSSGSNTVAGLSHTHTLTQHQHQHQHQRGTSHLFSKHVHLNRTNSNSNNSSSKKKSIKQDLLELYSSETDAIRALDNSLALALPCLLTVEPVLTSPTEKEVFSTVMLQLGLLEIPPALSLIEGSECVSECVSEYMYMIAIGPHCDNNDFNEISDTLKKTNHFVSIVTVLNHFMKTTHVHVHVPINVTRNHDIKGTNTIVRSFGKVDEGGAYGDLLRRNMSIGVIEDVLPDKVFNVLYGRLMHQVAMTPNWHSLYLNDSESESVLEQVIISHLVPLVMGSQASARRDGFDRVEWWFQRRLANEPLGYHFDTDEPRCGRRSPLLPIPGHCPYRPSLSTVLYMTDTGGPTAVFDQYTKRHDGKVCPGKTECDGQTCLFPRKATLCFPKRNRMLMFPGDRLHGVMSDARNENSSAPRLTLLVNFFQHEDDRPYVPHAKHEVTKQEGLYSRMFGDVVRNSNTLDSVQLQQLESSFFPSLHYPVRFNVDHPFQEGLLLWSRQQLPSSLYDIMKMFSNDFSLLGGRYDSSRIATPFHLLEQKTITAQGFGLLAQMRKIIRARSVTYFKQSPVVSFDFQVSEYDAVADALRYDRTLDLWFHLEVDINSSRPFLRNVYSTCENVEIGG